MKRIWKMGFWFTVPLWRELKKNSRGTMGSVEPQITQRTWQEKEPVSKAATSMHPKWVISITVSSKSVFRCFSAIWRHSEINFFFFSKVYYWKWPHLIDHCSGKDVCDDVIIEIERRGNHTTPCSIGTGGQREELACGVGMQKLICRRARTGEADIHDEL